MTIETFLSKPYWVIDILPKQVPAGGGGQYFTIEKYFLAPPQVDIIYQKFANLVLKLNCYFDIIVSHTGDEWTVNPAPSELQEMVTSRRQLFIVLNNKKTMISITGDDHYMTVYDPNEEFLELTTTLASAEGLYVWKPKTI